MNWTLLLLSDAHEDIRDLLPAFPISPYQVMRLPLKSTTSAQLVPIHPDLILIDTTTDIASAEDATRSLAVAWEIGMPPIVAVLDEDGLGRFKLDGVDDFLLTDSSTNEISVRLTLASRRAGRSDEAMVLKVGDLTVNPENYQVYIRGKPLDLTYKEFELLKFLAQRPGRVCDRELLLREVWGYDYYGGTRTVDVHVRRLRAKLGPEHEALIETIRNVGYRLVPRPRER